MVHIKVQDCNFLNVISLLSILGSNSSVVEKTETTSLVSFSMMPGGANATECGAGINNG